MFQQKLVFTVLITSLFIGCGTKPMLQKEAPTDFSNAYFQNWNAGTKLGGSGSTIFIPVENNLTVLDSVYFRKKGAKLQYNTKQNIYVGYFKNQYLTTNDVVMSDNPLEESKNQITPLPKIPFNLKPNECVVSYVKNGKTLYYKIRNITQKETLNYPSAPPKQ